MKHLSALITLAFFLTSCATRPVPSDDLVAPVTSIATGVVLSRVSSPAARVETARQLGKIADAVQLITDETTTGAEIAVMIGVLTKGKPEYVPYASAMGLVFDRYLAKFGKSRVAQITHEMAVGIKITTDPYL